MRQLEEKCEFMITTITGFLVKFTNLRQKGLPDIMVLNDKLMPQNYYDKKIRYFAKEHVNKPSGPGIPTGKVLLKNFEDLFYLQHEIKHLFVIKPMFAKYTEADENFRKLKNLQIPKNEEWQAFTDLL